MLKNLNLYFYWTKNLIIILYSKLFNINYDPSVIPKDTHYCYIPDHEKNKTSESIFTDGYYIIPCKYYKTIGRRYNGCQYLGIITDDFEFEDKCKMCGENYPNYS